jgi:hypothetical protein
MKQRQFVGAEVTRRTLSDLLQPGLLTSAPTTAEDQGSHDMKLSISLLGLVALVSQKATKVTKDYSSFPLLSSVKKWSGQADSAG